MKYYILFLFVFFCYIPQIFAGSLVAPFPALVTSEVNTNLRYNLINKEKIELFCSTGASLDFSILPLFSVPSLELSMNLSSSLFYNKTFTGFNLCFNTGINYYINPFFYKNKFYEMDYLLSSNTDLTVNYRYILNDNWYLEPYLGGRLQFFGSLTSYCGTKTFLSLIGGIKITMNINRFFK